MIEVNEILQTMQMIHEQHFDIRTITMGISLLSCKKNTDRETAEAVYEKVTRLAKNLVPVGEALEMELGIPIVNKRISVTPVSMISDTNPVLIAKALDEAAAAVGVNLIGGYGALMHKGSTRAEEILLDSMPEAFRDTQRLCGSVNVGSTRSGINMDAVRRMGHVIKKTAELTADSDGFGCAKIVVFANAVEDNPFMAGAFHGMGEPECVVNVGVSGPGVVQRALQEIHGQPFDVLAETIKRTAFKITRVGELVAQEAAKRLQRALRDRRPFSGSHARPGGQRGLHPAGNGPADGRRARNHGRAGHAERHGQEGRRNGVQPRGRPERRVYSRQRGHRHDRSRRSPLPDHRKAGGHDLCLLRRSGHDRHPRRHQRQRHCGHHCRRSGHRHGQQQDHGCPGHSRARKESGRRGQLRRPLRLCPRHARESCCQRRIHRARRPHPRPPPQPPQLGQGYYPCTPDCAPKARRAARGICGLAGVLPPWHDRCHGSPVWCGSLQIV